jgi:hypothetical protein
MNPEIENLINVALTDGEVTEKERAIILRKAESMGLDKDEVEMILDAKIHEKNNIQVKPIKEKVGNIKTCPACGATVKAMELGCNDCGNEFSNIKANSAILDLVAKIEKIDLEKNSKISSLKGGARLLQSADYIVQKAELIRNYPVPNTKDDILEFLTYSTSKLTTNVSGNPWHAKAEEIIMKSRFLFKNDQMLLSTLDKYEKDIKNRKKGEMVIVFVSIIFMLLAVALVMIFGSNLK